MQGYDEIKKSEEKYRHLFEKSPVSIYITDRNGVILNINPSCIALLGYSDSSLLCGQPLESFFTDPQDWEKYHRVNRGCFQVGDGSQLCSQLSTAAFHHCAHSHSTRRNFSSIIRSKASPLIRVLVTSLSMSLFNHPSIHGIIQAIGQVSCFNLFL